MKATLATLVCLLTVGFLSAAEVAGNNTAVVIRKKTVMAKNGYQFLCIPVNGLDITNGDATEIKLSTVLPPAILPKSTRAIIGGVTYTVSADTGSADTVSAEKKWVDDAGNVVDDLSLPGGTMIWLNTLSRTDPTATPPEAIVFCGQDRRRVAMLYKNMEGIVDLKNDSSVAISLDQAANFEGTTGPNEGDLILTIQAGSSEYKQYEYLKGTSDEDTGWYSGLGITQKVTGDVIAPGEAFYYYKASSAGSNSNTDSEE